MQQVRYYEDLTLEDIIIDFDTKFWDGAYDRLNLLYEKGGYELLREFAKWFYDVLNYLYKYGRPEFDDFNWFSERINEKINELLKEEE